MAFQTGDSETYESPQYGFTLTYDPAVWTLLSPDPDANNDAETVIFSNQVSIIFLIATPSYNKQSLPECRDEIADSWSNFDDKHGFETDATDDHDANDHASGTYAYTTGAFDTPYTVYIECFALDNVAVAIAQDVPTADYTDEVEAREGFLSGLAPAASADDDDSNTFASEPGHYVSPTYRYEIPYDADTWEVTADESSDGVDSFEVSGDDATVRFIGLAATGDAHDCLDAAAKAALAQDAFRDYDDDVNADGKPYAGTGVIGPYTGFSDGTNILYLECGLSPDENIALVVRIVAKRIDFNDAIESVNDILTGIVWGEGETEQGETNGSRYGGLNNSGGGGDNGGDDDGESASSANSYIDEENGWSITWSDAWEQIHEINDADVLELRSGDVDVLLYIIPDMSDAEACLDLKFEQLTEAQGVSDVEILRRDGKRVRGGDQDAAFIAYTYQYQGSGDPIPFVDHYDCRILPSGNDALMMSHIVVARLYDDEALAVAALLEGLTIGDS